MDILSKHPAPWSMEEFSCAPPRPYLIVDAHGVTVLHAHPDRREIVFSDGPDGSVRRLILAAPELLAALKDCLAATFKIDAGGTIRDCIEWGDRTIPDPRIKAQALISRIEGK